MASPDAVNINAMEQKNVDFTEITTTTACASRTSTGI